MSDAGDCDGWVFDENPNPWRHKAEDANVIEMLLPCGRVTLINAYRHGDVRMHPWVSNKEHSNMFYARTGYVNGPGEWKFIYLHALLNAQWEERDHINRDGLDNRDENIRDGRLLNQFNRGLKNEGVRKKNPGNSWVISWTTLDGKDHSMHFPCKRGDPIFNAAQRELAVQIREQKRAEIIAEIMASRPMVVDRVVAKIPVQHKRGGGGCFVFPKRPSGYYSMQLTVAKQRASNKFGLRKHTEEDLVLAGVLHESDFAMDEALEWRAKTNAELLRTAWEKNRKRQREETCSDKDIGTDVEEDYE